MNNKLLVPDELYDWIVNSIFPLKRGPIKAVRITIDRSEI